MTTKTPETTAAARKQLLPRIAAAQKSADSAKKAAKLAKLTYRNAKQKFKDARRAAKKLRKELKALKAELAAIVVKRPRRKPAARKTAAATPTRKRVRLIVSPANSIPSSETPASPVENPSAPLTYPTPEPPV